MTSVPSDMPARLGQLFAGLVLFGVALAVVIDADLGLDPWNVFHQGVSEHTGLGLGWVVVLVSGLVLLAWVPLRQRPGIGTVANALVVGAVIEAALPLVPDPDGLALRLVYLAVGVVVSGVALGLYIGAGLGPGPRDGLMTGLAARGHSVRVVRTTIEVGALVGGWLLGGSVGLGTLAYALCIGPIAHVTLPRFDRGSSDRLVEGDAVVPEHPEGG